MEMSYDAEIPHLRICPKKPKTLIQKNACTAIFIAALFATAKIWKQPKCPSAEQWLKNLWSMNTMEYYSAVKKRKGGEKRHTTVIE